MIKTVLLLVFFSVLSGCINIDNGSRVGYAKDARFFENPDERTTLSESKRSTITWRKVEDPDKYCRAWLNQNLEDVSKPIRGCSAWISYPRRECIIVTGPEPKFETVGHELNHCYYGHFHVIPTHKTEDGIPKT